MAAGVIMNKTAPIVMTFVVLLVAAAGSLTAPAASLPRKSPEFTIVEPSGKTTLLSSFKGKVVVMEFLFTGSPRCLNLVETLNKLNHELGPRGFQPLAVAFGPDASVSVLTRLADHFKLTFPFGYSTRDDVD